MTSGTHLTGEVLLECGNILFFEVAPPVKGTEVWCRKHGKMEKVEKQFRGETYRIKCNTCRYGRNCGSGRLAAETAMVRHRTKRGMHHEMVLMNAQHKILWKLEANQVETLELPNF